ncbi:MAG: hypothetical protein Q9164_005915 [Protoblastenia rupestris]
MDAEEKCRWALYDAAASLIFGKKIGFIDEGRDVDGLLDAYRGLIWFLGLMAIFPYLLNPIVKLPIIKRFALPHSGDKKGVGKTMKVSVQRANKTPILNFWQLRDNLVKDSKANNRQSLMKSLTKLIATQKHALNDDDLNAELLMMMIAASDTTSTLIYSIVDQVIQHPDVHRRLVSEIMVATAAGNLNHPVATFTQIRNLPFFTACIKESARLFPSVPGNRVDLVVAYIAALKAGAIVSVLGPHYPPERQKILLDIARPKFLVCL